MVGRDDCRGQMAFWSLVNSYDQIMSFPVDSVTKTEHILRTLDIGDYLTIASNRFYDTETRNPMRWPLTTLYYEKLFAGELGYELVAVFDEPFALGPWRVSDQHLPIYDSPAWLKRNRKPMKPSTSTTIRPFSYFASRRITPAPKSRRRCRLFHLSKRTIWNRLMTKRSLLGVLYWTSHQADPVPTALTFPASDYETQTAGGAWSERFFSERLANRNQALGVVFWYLLLAAFGIVAFPIVHAGLPKNGGRWLRRQQADRFAAGRLVRLGRLDLESAALVSSRLVASHDSASPRKRVHGPSQPRSPVRIRARKPGGGWPGWKSSRCWPSCS